MEQVRNSTRFVVQHSTLVSINESALERLAAELKSEARKPVPWKSFPCHYTGEKKLDFVFAIDALNFCFWPNPGYEYNTLAEGLKELLETDENALSPERLRNITEEQVSNLILRGKDLCLIEERTRLLQELGKNTIRDYQGSYETLVSAASGSAERLVDLVTGTFPGFRDAAIYKGRQIFFYKRAQILVGDIWGAFDGEGIGRFHDIGNLTMFADYRVPQLLEHREVLRYAEELKEKINRGEEIPHGSQAEVEIRSACVQACDQIRSLTNLSTAVECDWVLWQWGESLKSAISPPHKTLSIFY